MKLKSKIAIGLALIAGLTLGSVVPANAASKNGTQGCGGTYSAYVDVDSTGSTRVSWQNLSNGATRSQTFSTGGLNRGWGYQQSSWVVTASTIKKVTPGCG
jgi:hypothetical protein